MQPLRDLEALDAQFARVPDYVRGTLSLAQSVEFEELLVISSALVHEVELEYKLRRGMECAARLAHQTLKVIAS